MQLTVGTEFYGHSFDEITGLYLLPVRIFPEEDGATLLPDNTVDFPPEEAAGPHQAWQINAAQTAWTLVADYRGAMLWDKTSASPVPNLLDVGEDLPASVTLHPPIPLAPGTPAMNQWSAERDEWVLTPDYSQTPVWHKQTGAILPMLKAGDPLPDHATALPPPRDQGGPVYFDDDLGEWVELPPPEMPDFPSVRPEPPEGSPAV